MGRRLETGWLTPGKIRARECCHPSFISSSVEEHADESQQLLFRHRGADTHTRRVQIALTRSDLTKHDQHQPRPSPLSPSVDYQATRRREVQSPAPDPTHSKLLKKQTHVGSCPTSAHGSKIHKEEKKKTTNRKKMNTKQHMHSSVSAQLLFVLQKEAQENRSRRGKPGGREQR